MKRNHNSKKVTASNSFVAALALLLSASGTVQAVSAQEMPSTGSYSSASSLGPDQDSLLPPEVVPLDPATANSMSQAQAANRQSSYGSASGSNAPNNNSFATQGSFTPGLVSNGIPQGMQSAKDARNAAFNSLYGQGNLAPMQGNMPPMQVGGGVSQNQIIGQAPMMNGSGSAPFGAPAAQPMMAPQSQTLTGGSKIQPKVRDIKRAGVSNMISGLAGFGAGAITAGALMRPANPMMGLGMFGLTMTGFGVRNAFRF